MKQCELILAGREVSVKNLLWDVGCTVSVFLPNSGL